jgi:hypothetical protein
MKIRILVITILLGCHSLHGMNSEAENEKVRKEKEELFASARRWHEMAVQARALKNNAQALAAAQAEGERILAAQQAQAAPDEQANARARRHSIRASNDIIPTPQATTAMITQNPPQVAQIRCADDDDDTNHPLLQYFNGKRNDLDAILDACDKKEEESRSSIPTSAEKAITVVQPKRYNDEYDDFS